MGLIFSSATLHILGSSHIMTCHFLKNPFTQYFHILALSFFLETPASLELSRQTLQCKALAYSLGSGSIRFPHLSPLPHCILGVPSLNSFNIILLVLFPPEM